MSIICTVDDREVDCQTWDDPRETLLQMLKRDAYRKGEFKLSSGRTSEHYVNCKPVTLSGKGIALVSPMLLECIEDDSVAVGGLTLGADPLVTGVSQSAWFHDRSLDALIVRKEAKGHGTGAWIEGPLPPEGSVVTVLEDVITTGSSALFAAEKLRDAGYVTNRVVSIVNRQEGGEASIIAEGLELVSLFTLEDLLSDVKS